MDARFSQVKALLGISGEDKDELIKFSIKVVEHMILSYINQEEIPQELEDVLIAMCVSYYKQAALGTETAAVGAVTSVKRGDVQTSFAGGNGASGSAGTFNLGVDSGDFFGWETALDAYRKLRW